jgi:hypothetical protein
MRNIGAESTDVPKPQHLLHPTSVDRWRRVVFMLSIPTIWSVSSPRATRVGLIEAEREHPLTT